MKKVIAAAAGLMLAGTMASAAVAAEAGVKFSGDARARYYLQNEYASADSEDTHWNSRVRLKFTAESKGGAYAKARFRLADATWDGTQQTRDTGEGSNLYTDYAFIGVPFGPVTIEAGLMPRNLTEFLEWDTRVDSVQGKFSAGNSTVVAFYEVVDEYEEDEDGNVTDADAIDDNDIGRFGVWYDQKFGEGWGVTATGVYTDDAQTTDATGFAGAVKVAGGIGATGLAAEHAFKEGDLIGSEDDALGGYISATFGVGAANLGAVAGFAYDGFEADGDFGPFIMLSDYSQIATGSLIGSGGDTVFYALTADFKATEMLSFGVVGAYASQDTAGDAFEIGATASYAVTDGAKLNGVIGYLDQDEADNNPNGFGLSLEISY